MPKTYQSRARPSIVQPRNSERALWARGVPDYRTQGETLAELQENLKDIYAEFTGGSIPAVRRIGELVVG